MYILSKRDAFIGIICLFLISLFWYLINPKLREPSLPDFYCSVAMMLVSTFLYYKAARKKNYFDFDTLFIPMFFFVGFFSTFFYDTEIYPYLFLHFSFDENYINASAWLFVIGIQAYYLGRLSKVVLKPLNEKRIIDTTFMAVMIVVLTFLFLLLGGLQHYQAIYDDANSSGSGIVIQIQILLTSFVIAFIATEFYNKKVDSAYRLKWEIFCVVLFFSCLLLYVGNRTLPSFFVLGMIGSYTLLFYSVNLKKMCLFIGVGVVAMWAISQMRSSYELNMISNSALFFVDLTVNNRNTYVAMEYVDDEGYTWGRTMLGGPLAIIPFASHILGIDNRKVGSAEVLTDYSFAINHWNREQIGLGTNIIADIYLSFGLLGVIVLMYLLGKAVNKYLCQAKRLDYYSLIVYTVIMAYGIYGVRTGLTHPCRMLVWALVIAYLNKNLVLFLCKK